MTGKQKALLGCLTLAVVVVFSVISVLAVTQIPDVTQQLPPNTTPFIVTITSPLNGNQVPLDAFTTVNADAISNQPITLLEFWLDGALAQSSPAQPPNNNGFGAFWTWTPSTEGEHVLIVRATDAANNIGTSNVVRVNATKTANVGSTVNYQTQAGETLPVIAEEFKTTPQQIIDLNPKINPNGSIVPGQIISVPLPVSLPPPPNPPSDSGQQTPPGDPVPPAPNDPPNNIQFWIDKNLLGNLFKQNLPPAPGLAQKQDGCNVKLYITDFAINETGFFIYRADANSQIFKRIATLSAHSGTGAFTYTDSNVYGHVAYYVASFNIAGESPSKYVQAEITNAACLISPWQMIQLNQAKIVVQQPVDKVYCYLSTNNDPWTRVPPVPNTFIFPQNGEFDVSEYIKTLLPTQANGPVTLDLECWGWSGSTLVFLGEAKETFQPTPKPLPIKFESTKFAFKGNLVGTQVMSGTLNAQVTHPFNLKGTTNPAECAAHYPPGQIPDQQGWCSGQITSKKLILVWEWDPKSSFICTKGPCVTTIHNIEGYKLYGFGVYPDGTQVNRTLLATFTPANSKGYATYPFPGVCYAVRAFAGPIESVDSNVFCPPPDSIGAETVKLKLQQPPNGLSQRFAWYWNKKPFSVSLDPYGIRACGPGEDQVCVGFDWLRDLDNYDELQTYYQGAVRFDLNPILNKSVVKAILRYRRVSGSFVVANDAGNGMSCAQWLGIGTTNWKDYDVVNGDHDAFLPFDTYKTLPTNLSYAPYVIDVTPIVANWANGSNQNNGFILHGIEPFGPPGKKYENQCTTTYGDFELEVTYGK